MWDTWEVYKADVYARVRRAVQVEGMSIRQAAREFGLSRKTIRKMQFALPPGYERKKPVVRPKLGPLGGRDRSDPGGRSVATKEAAA